MGFERGMGRRRRRRRTIVEGSGKVVMERDTILPQKSDPIPERIIQQMCCSLTVPLGCGRLWRCEFLSSNKIGI